MPLSDGGGATGHFLLKLAKNRPFMDDPGTARSGDRPVSLVESVAQRPRISAVTKRFPDDVNTSAAEDRRRSSWATQCLPLLPRSAIKVQLLDEPVVESRPTLPLPTRRTPILPPNRRPQSPSGFMVLRATTYAASGDRLGHAASRRAQFA